MNAAAADMGERFSRATFVFVYHTRRLTKFRGNKYYSWRGLALISCTGVDLNSNSIAFRCNELLYLLKPHFLTRALKNTEMKIGSSRRQENDLLL